MCKIKIEKKREKRIFLTQPNRRQKVHNFYLRCTAIQLVFLKKKKPTPVIFHMRSRGPGSRIMQSLFSASFLEEPANPMEICISIQLHKGKEDKNGKKRDAHDGNTSNSVQ